MFFQVFAYEEYYPHGGMEDCICIFHSDNMHWAIEHAKHVAWERFSKTPDVIELWGKMKSQYSPSRVWSSHGGEEKGGNNYERALKELDAQ